MEQRERRCGSSADCPADPFLPRAYIPLLITHSLGAWWSTTRGFVILCCPLSLGRCPIHLWRTAGVAGSLSQMCLFSHVLASSHLDLRILLLFLLLLFLLLLSSAWSKLAQTCSPPPTPHAILAWTLIFSYSLCVSAVTNSNNIVLALFFRIHIWPWITSWSKMILDLLQAWWSLSWAEQIFHYSSFVWFHFGRNFTS